MAGNWKMNCNHLEAIRLVQDLAFRLSDADYEAVDVVVLPPFTDLRSVQTLVDGDHLSLGYGAQDLSVHDSGAYTGDVSGPMLAKLGCGYVLAGHSERRQHHAESDETVNAKVRTAHRHGLVPVLCVGEPLVVRQAGEHLPHVLGQLSAGLAELSPEQVATTVVAYEPVWAIGTGEVATPDDAQEVCAALRTSVGETIGPDVAQRVR
ncbi:MAG: triose-phosphate isomerase, partial [Actinomycetes bacterium]